MGTVTIMCAVCRLSCGRPGRIPRLPGTRLASLIIMKEQRRLEKHVEHSIGSARNPMTNAQLEAKFAGFAEGVLPPNQTRRLMDLCWNLSSLPEAAQLARAAAV